MITERAMTQTPCGHHREVGKGEAAWTCDLPAGHGGPHHDSVHDRAWHDEASQADARENTG